MDTVKRAAMRATGDSYVAGAPAGAFLAALRANGEAAVLAAIDAAPADLRVPRLSEWVRLHAGDYVNGAAPPGRPAPAPAPAASFYSADREEAGGEPAADAVAAARAARALLGGDSR